MFSFVTGFWLPILIVFLLGFLMVRQPILRPANILVLYWMMMIIIGISLFPISSTFIELIDTELLPKSVWLYVLAFAFFAIGLIQYRLMKPYTGEIVFIKPDKMQAASFVPWLLVIICVLILALTYHTVGYIPMLAGDVQITKYFQDDFEVYVKYRPIYTFALNTLATVLTFSLAMIFQARSRTNWIWLGACSAGLLLLSAKRGPLLLPFLNLGLAYAILKNNIKIFVVAVGILGVLGVILHLDLFADIDFFEKTIFTISMSFFVGVRELTRLLTIDTGDLLWGKSYLAGLLSFIPTEWFEFKAKYNYMRYIMTLEGADPNMSGGMRASYIGEALINFGMFGVVVVSYIFGLATGWADRWFTNSRLISKYGLVGIIFVFTIFQNGYIGFFENGSSALLFLINRTFIFFILIFLCLPHRRVLSNDINYEAKNNKI